MRGHLLSSKKHRLCICTYHKARGIFDVWRKWILERPVDILTKSFPFLKKYFELLLPAAPSLQCENILQCPGQWQQFSSLTDYIIILYTPGKISTVPDRVQLALYYIKVEFNPSAHLVHGPSFTPVTFSAFFKAHSHKKKTKTTCFHELKSVQHKFLRWFNIHATITVCSLHPTHSNRRVGTLSHSAVGCQAR